MGYDLDGRCTGNDASTTSDSPCRRSGPPVIDADGGVDNALGASLDDFNFFGDSDDPLGEAANTNVDRGSFTNLVALFRYNGLANDGDVSVQIAASGALLSAGCDGGPREQGPQWDGCDLWSHSTDLIVDRQKDQRPFWQTKKGYVVDDVLVLVSDDAKIGLGFGEFAISGAILTARIERSDGGSLRLTDGVIAGRAKASAVIDAVRFLEFGGAICNDDVKFKLLRNTVCGACDLPARPADDGRGLECDAVSLALGFEAEKAEVGSKLPLPDASCPEQDLTCP